jgi:hypothetical protein
MSSKRPPLKPKGTYNKPVHDHAPKGEKPHLRLADGTRVKSSRTISPKAKAASSEINSNARSIYLSNPTLHWYDAHYQASQEYRAAHPESRSKPKSKVTYVAVSQPKIKGPKYLNG